MARENAIVIDDMRLLNDETLCDYVNRPDPLLVRGLDPPKDWSAENSPVQPSSIDLRIGEIFLPGTKHGMDGSEDKPLSTHTLGPGETAMVTTLETLNLPSNVAAIGFPPSRISEQGILMTNPGHVDPGYVGPMHFTVINMGKQEFSLRKGGMIVTVLFFEMSPPAKQDYAARGAKSRRIDQEAINRLSRDFLDVKARAKEVAKEEIHGFEIRRTILGGIISIALGLATYFVPLWTGLGELKERVARLETLGNLEKRVTTLEIKAGLPSPPAGPGNSSAPTVSGGRKTKQ